MSCTSSICPYSSSFSSQNRGGRDIRGVGIRRGSDSNGGGASLIVIATPRGVLHGAAMTKQVAYKAAGLEVARAALKCLVVVQQF